MAESPSKANQRRGKRFLVTPRGEITDGATTVKVLIQDISDEGMLLVCSREFAVGRVLTLKFQVAASTTVECSVEVRHSNDMGTGVKIVAMDEQNRRIYDRYLQEYFSNQLGKLG